MIETCKVGRWFDNMEVATTLIEFSWCNSVFRKAILEVQEHVMFENLTDRLTGIFNRLSSKGRLTEKDIDEALSQVQPVSSGGGRQLSRSSRLCSQS